MISGRLQSSCQGGSPKYDTGSGSRATVGEFGSSQEGKCSAFDSLFLYPEKGNDMQNHSFLSSGGRKVGGFLMAMGLF